jgi:hypothetical protein
MDRLERRLASFSVVCYGRVHGPYMPFFAAMAPSCMDTNVDAQYWWVQQSHEVSRDLIEKRQRKIASVSWRRNPPGLTKSQRMCYSWSSIQRQESRPVRGRPCRMGIQHGSCRFVLCKNQ